MAVDRGLRRQPQGHSGYPRGRRRGDAHRRRARSRSRRRQRLQPVLVGRAGRDAAVGEGKGAGRLVAAQNQKRCLARLPPQPVARHCASRRGRRPAQVHRVMCGPGGHQIARYPRRLRQARGGAAHRHATGRHPVGTTGTLAETQQAVPAAPPRRALPHQVEDRGFMRAPAVAHRRPWPPAIGAPSADSWHWHSVPAAAACGPVASPDGVTQPLCIATAHPVMVDRAGVQTGVVPAQGQAARGRPPPPSTTRGLTSPDRSIPVAPWPGRPPGRPATPPALDCPPWAAP